MSTSRPPGDGPTTDSEFNDQLGTLIRRAHGNGVDVEGGWAFRTEHEDRPDWGVEIYEVTKPRRSVDIG